MSSIIDNEDIVFRQINLNDYDKGYFELLQNLTVTTKSSKEEFAERLEEIRNSGLIKIYVGVYQDRKIISTITVLLEPKFIRNMGKVCHIEDFVVHPDFQKLKLGSRICELIKSIASENKCYKIILDCSEDVKPFYIKQGFEQKSCGMSFYFDK